MSKSYSWPNFKWYQFTQKRKWRKAMSRLSAGDRIKLRTAHVELPTFTDDFVVEGWVKVKKR